MTAITYRIGRPPAPPARWRRVARWIVWRWAAPTAFYSAAFWLTLLALRGIR